MELIIKNEGKTISFDMTIYNYFIYGGIVTAREARKWI